MDPYVASAAIEPIHHASTAVWSAGRLANVKLGVGEAVVGTEVGLIVGLPVGALVGLAVGT